MRPAQENCGQQDVDGQSRPSALGALSSLSSTSANTATKHHIPKEIRGQHLIKTFPSLQLHAVMITGTSIHVWLVFPPISTNQVQHTSEATEFQAFGLQMQHQNKLTLNGQSSREVLL